MISISTSSSDSSQKALSKMRKQNLLSNLDKVGAEGVRLLREATPVESGETREGWAYRVVEERNGPRIEWYNTHDSGSGTPVAVLIQYGHGTKNGGYVPSIDYINPAIQPLFDQVIDELWKKVMMA